nr:MAG TPA: hypothetical protein [Caudoviricetes sp.]
MLLYFVYFEKKKLHMCKESYVFQRSSFYTSEALPFSAVHLQAKRAMIVRLT